MDVMDEAFKSERFLSYIQVLSNARSSNIETMRKIYKELQNRDVGQVGICKGIKATNTLGEKFARVCLGYAPRAGIAGPWVYIEVG
jgi:hypothetical protein